MLKTFFSPVLSPKSCHHSLQSVPRTDINLSTYKTFWWYVDKIALNWRIFSRPREIQCNYFIYCICSRWRCRPLRTAGIRKPIFSMERKFYCCLCICSGWRRRTSPALSSNLRHISAYDRLDQLFLLFRIDSALIPFTLPPLSSRRGQPFLDASAILPPFLPALLFHFFKQE